LAGELLRKSFRTSHIPDAIIGSDWHSAGGIAGNDVFDGPISRTDKTRLLAGIAAEARERSTLLACFRPSVEQLFEEQVAIHRKPTLDDVRGGYQPSPMKRARGSTELVEIAGGNIFSETTTLAADGRLAESVIRGAGTFLDECLR